MRHRAVLLLSAGLSTAAVGGCHGNRSPSASHSTSALPTTPVVALASASFSPSGLSFTYPASWHQQTYNVSSSFSTLITYLSTTPLRDPCVRQGTAAGQSVITCSDPTSVIEPGTLLVSWANIAFPHLPSEPEVTNPNTTLAGQNARVTIDHPGTCARVQADETITADIVVPRGMNHLEMMACLRAPGLASHEHEIDAMLASTQIAG